MSTYRRRIARLEAKVTAPPDADTEEALVYFAESVNCTVEALVAETESMLGEVDPPRTPARVTAWCAESVNCTVAEFTDETDRLLDGFRSWQQSRV